MKTPLVLFHSLVTAFALASVAIASPLQATEGFVRQAMLSSDFENLTPAQRSSIFLNQLKNIQLVEAQQVSQGAGITVAVIDSGINLRREDLHFLIRRNAGEIPDNGIDDDNNGLVDDVYGWNFYDNNQNLTEGTAHGSMSASVIAARNIGVAPASKVVPIKITDPMTVASPQSTKAALKYALEMDHIQIINFSMGIGALDVEMLTLIKKLENKGILLVAAAGNRGKSCADNPSLSILNLFSNVITVGALNLPPAPVQSASYSNHGDCVDIAAPSGEYRANDIYSRGIISIDPDSPTGFRTYNGTSAAAPVVSGVAALIKSKYPEMSASQIKQRLLDCADKYPSLADRVLNGRVINAYRSLMGCER